MSQSIKEMCERYNDLAWLKDDKTENQRWEYEELEDAIWEAGTDAESEDDNPALQNTDAWYIWQEGFDHMKTVHGKDYEEGNES